MGNEIYEGSEIDPIGTIVMTMIYERVVRHSCGCVEVVSCLLPSKVAVGGVAQGALKARHSSLLLRLLLRLELNTLEVPSSISSMMSSCEKPSSSLESRL